MMMGNITLPPKSERISYTKQASPLSRSANQAVPRPLVSQIYIVPHESCCVPLELHLQYLVLPCDPPLWLSSTAWTHTKVNGDGRALQKSTITLNIRVEQDRGIVLVV